MKNKIIIISSPSGAGKTTICKEIIKHNKNIKLSVSYTTRPKRRGEINSKDYFFVTNHYFNQLNKENFFVETARVFDFLYGSPYVNIETAFKKGHNILFDIDWKGAKKLRKKFDKNDIIDFFILPPNKKELKKRLQIRGRDRPSEIKKRLSLAVNEISHYKEYKYVLVNDSILSTVNTIKDILKYEKILMKIRMNIKSADIY